MRKYRIGLVLAGTLLGGTVGCSPATHSTPHSSATSSTSGIAPTAPVSSAADVPLLSGKQPCYVPLPAAWQSAYQLGQLWSRTDDKHQTGAPLPDGSGVLYSQDVGKVTEVGIIGAHHQVVQQVGSVPNPYGEGQVTYNQINDKYGEFVYAPLNGDTASYNWRIYLWDRTAKALKLIASNPTDSQGQALQGGWVEPMLTDKYVTWIQALPRTNPTTGSELVQYNLTTGATRVLYRGLVSSFVPYNDTVLYAAVVPGAKPAQDGSLPMHLAALSADSGTAVTPPAGLTFAADNPNTLRTDGNLIVWSTDQLIRAWQPAWKRTVTLIPSAVEGWPEATTLQLGPPGYPRLYGHFLVWDSNGTYVLDLRNDVFSRFETAAGGLDLSGSMLSIEQYSAGTTYNRTTNVGTYDQHVVDLSKLDDLPNCSK